MWSTALIKPSETPRRELPGELERVMLWFRDYKIPDGKAPNGFGYGGAALGASMAGRVISDTHALYLARHAQFSPYPAHVAVHQNLLCIGCGGAALGASTAGRVMSDTHALYLARHAQSSPYPAHVAVHQNSQGYMLLNNLGFVARGAQHQHGWARDEQQGF